MFDENLLYSETMQLLLNDKNTQFMYQGFDPSLLPKNQSIWEIQNNFDLDDDEFESLESKTITHLLAEQPNPTPHMFCSENLTAKFNLDQ